MSKLALWLFHLVMGRRCWHCGRRFWMTDPYKGTALSEFCSRKCYDEWIPF